MPPPFNLQPATFCPFFFFKKQAKPTKHNQTPKDLWTTHPSQKHSGRFLGGPGCLPLTFHPMQTYPISTRRESMNSLQQVEGTESVYFWSPSMSWDSARIVRYPNEQETRVVALFPFLRPKSCFLLTRFYTSQVVSQTSSINSMDLPAMVVGHPSFLEKWNVCEILPSDPKKPKHKARIQSFPPSNTPEGCLTQKNWSPKGIL